MAITKADVKNVGILAGLILGLRGLCHGAWHGGSHAGRLIGHGLFSKPPEEQLSAPADVKALSESKKPTTAKKGKKKVTAEAA